MRADGMLCIAIDVMGGDHGPPVTVTAARQVLEQDSGIGLLLCGERSRIEPWLEKFPPDLRQRCAIEHAESVFPDTERPERILRNGEGTSMYHAVDAVAEKRADACVSAGNTGALLLVSRHRLAMLLGVDKPALVAAIPVFSGGRRSLLLDVGATPRCSAEQLYQFGIMGAVLLSTLGACQRPRVALLNIGTEEHKGSPAIHATARLFERATDTLEYAGFVEANRVFEGDADVLVCDGFSGNMTIKASAGAVQAVNRMIGDVVRRHPVRASLATPLFREIRREADPAPYNGASLLGLGGIVVKSHGNADEQGFAHAIRYAAREARQQVPDVIAREIGRIFRRESL